MNSIFDTIRLAGFQPILDNSMAKLRYRIAMRKAHRNFGFNPDELLVFRTPRTRCQAVRQTRVINANRRES